MDQKTTWEEQMKQEFEKKGKTQGDIHREKKFALRKSEYRHKSEYHHKKKSKDTKQKH